ncbi:hypothetical protein [Streptomyces sp. NBC_00120]|uniref:hypothetical protein n=1 Tax=unclassified Streptomyces TaxID=2593676 RepID=UPI00225531F5|nr:hypothetical protein [Streptomyces sp. NBC_00120]MCX5321042.1 hypothetical protein [Streptomyces sp. NBC_00120]
MPVLALTGTLFVALWVTQLHGPQAIPNHWTALSALSAVGCFVRAAGNRSNRRALIGLCLALAAAALFRPTDALWLSLPMAAAGLCARRWRRPALLTALFAGLALGGAQWVVEAYCPTAAWSHGRTAPAASRAASAGKSRPATNCAQWQAAPTLPPVHGALETPHERDLGAGIQAAATFGPLMRFTWGTVFAAPGSRRADESGARRLGAPGCDTT